MKKKIESKTVKVFDILHKEQLRKKKIFFRLKNLLSTKFLRVDKNFFKKKVCLDAGCGANANATYNLLKLGAKFVHGIDINKSVLVTARKTIDKKFKGKSIFKVSNLLKIDYPDNFFDFVHCAGAVHHTFSYKKSIKELCRVTKPGGYLYLEFYGKGGLVREITNLLRKKYKKEKKFKKIIDGLNSDELKKINSFMKKSFLKNNVKDRKNLLKNIKNNFEEDLILTIKDRLQSPLYEEFDYFDALKILKKNKFQNINRVSKYPNFFNIRRYLAPLYFDYENKYSRLFYGDGMPQILARKKNK